MPKVKGKRTPIFVDPEHLPSIREVLREFQRIRKRAIRVSPNLVDTSVEARQVNQDIFVKFSQIGRSIAGCGNDDDWCVICDSAKDDCSKCDAFDCIGCDAEEFSVDGDIVSNPAPLTHELTFRRIGAPAKKK